MKKVRILSLDGGGIRGIIPATIVKYIEDEIRKKEGDEKRLADYFDMVVGTSTGGMLAGFYLTKNPKGTVPSTEFEAQQALDLYMKKGVNIFNDSKYFSWFGMRQLVNAVQYNPKVLENLLEDNFGDNMMHDLLKPCTITTYNLNRKKAFFIRSEDHSTRNRTFKVKDALRSTSAAPTYFPPAKIQNHAEKLNKNEDKFMYNIDGGVFANNPTLCAYSEARNMTFKDQGVEFPTGAQMLIVSIGTGGGNFELADLNKSSKWGVIKWAKATPNIMMDGSIDTVDYQMKQLYGTMEADHQKNYLRIDVPQDFRKYEADMADASKENCENLMIAGEKTRDFYKKDLDAMIDRLIKGE